MAFPSCTRSGKIYKYADLYMDPHVHGADLIQAYEIESHIRNERETFLHHSNMIPQPDQDIIYLDSELELEQKTCVTPEEDTRVEELETHIKEEPTWEQKTCITPEEDARIEELETQIKEEQKTCITPEEDARIEEWAKKMKKERTTRIEKERASFEKEKARFEEWAEREKTRYEAWTKLAVEVERTRAQLREENARLLNENRRLRNDNARFEYERTSFEEEKARFEAWAECEKTRYEEWTEMLVDEDRERALLREDNVRLLSENHSLVSELMRLVIE